MSTLLQVFRIKQAKKLYLAMTRLAKKQASSFTHSQKSMIKHHLAEYQNKILSHSSSINSKFLQDLKEFKKEHLDLKGMKKWIHFIYTTLLALAAALLIRQMWFELYKVPTGSMRPTIKELDHLTVSKLNFSLNVPFTPAHFYFDPSLVKRSSICVFTSENMDVADADTRYFYLIPGKKLLVKRLIAKPGDTLYFYGGKIYGLDSAENDITNELNPENISKIDHIPFIQFLGEKEISYEKSSGIIYHMNAPYITFDSTGSFVYSIPGDLRAKTNFPSNMTGMWGIDNYALARILNSQAKNRLYPYDKAYSPKGLYLELKHSLHGISAQNTQSLPLKTETSLIPLSEGLSKKLFSSLYTARFEVLNGTLRRYGSSLPFTSKQLPKLHHIPDGTYEFYYGKAYQVLFGGITKQLDRSHPIYRYSSTALEVFFNLGIDFNTYFTPGMYEGWAPPRYSYFRDGTLYVMGMPFLDKNDPELESFVLNEMQKNEDLRFIDQGAPTKEDGSLDKSKILTLGMKVPDDMYFVLGDNHAQSADSRVFGFVPKQNLKGCPDIIFWPPGSRFGHLPQAMMTLLTMPRAIIWSAAWIIMILWIRYKKKRDVLPQDLSFLDS